MLAVPDTIGSVEQLDELLSRPSAALVEYVKTLDGDFMVMGASGKMGPTIARMAKRACDEAGLDRKVYAVARSAMPELEAVGVETISCDLLNLEAVKALPKAKNIIYMVGRKFGSAGAEHLTWAINALVPHNVVQAFGDSRIVAFSTGCVYPVTHLFSGGSTEQTQPSAVGEYAQSCLGRERIFEYASREMNIPVVQIRLNYAVEPRYGVLVDVATKVWNNEPVDIATGFANVIWQGDACDHTLRAFSLASTPQSALNITGPETFAIREVALQMGQLLGREVSFTGEPNGRGYLNNASYSHGLFGYPTVPLATLVKWTAEWVRHGGPSLSKPTHFETQDGQY